MIGIMHGPWTQSTPTNWPRVVMERWQLTAGDEHVADKGAAEATMSLTAQRIASRMVVCAALSRCSSSARMPMRQAGASSSNIARGRHS